MAFRQTTVRAALGDGTSTGAGATRSVRRFIGGAAAVLSLLVVATPAEADRTVVRGQWQCDDRGTIMALGGVETQLWRRGTSWLPVEWVGSIVDRGFANSNGQFALTANDDVENHFIRVALRDEVGVHLKDFYGINDWSVDTREFPNDATELTIGGLRFSTPGQSHKCAVWLGFHYAHDEFRVVTGTDPPSGGGLLINADAITAGVPFALHTTIMWPGGYPAGDGGGGDLSTTRHEFGHVIRHGYDGDLGHFLGDVVAHNYLRQHVICQKTGLGFAFNEGWAEYWAGQSTMTPACTGFAPNDFEVEGNVAAALFDLERRCLRAGGRAAMVAILRDNPGSIHSFDEFAAHAPCPAAIVAPLTTPPPPDPPVISASEAAAMARAEVEAVDRRLHELRVRLRRAIRAAASVPTCARRARRTRPCDAALRRVTRPAVLRAEIGLTMIVRRSVDDLDTAREQRALRKLGLRAGHDWMRAKERANRIVAARMSADGIRAALRAGRWIFARDTSRATRHLRSRLTLRMNAFRKAQRGAAAVPGLVLDQAIAERVKKVTQRQFPETPRLTLTCAPRGAAGNKTFTGTLSPARAGADIELHFIAPDTSEVVQTAKTGPTGAYSAVRFLPTYGTWTVFARWAGNGSASPQDSQGCQVPVELG